MSFIGSSELWGDEASARLCQILLEANDGMAQQITENRHDLLDLLTIEELKRVDDVGLTLQYLAVHYDRPEMLKYLHKRGIDLSKPCDPMGFGTPMFYAVSTGKIKAVEMLVSLGFSISSPCDCIMNLTPLYYAQRVGDRDVTRLIESIQHKERNAIALVRKNLQRHRERKEFLRTRELVIRIQRCYRGFTDRLMVRLIRAGHLVVGESMAESTEDGDGEDGTATGSEQYTGSGSGSSALQEGSLDFTASQSQSQVLDGEPSFTA